MANLFQIINDTNFQIFKRKKLIEQFSGGQFPPPIS